MIADRRTLAISVAAGALLVAQPLLARTHPGPAPEIAYDHSVAPTGEVTYDSAPVVQDTPSVAPPTVREVEDIETRGMPLPPPPAVAPHPIPAPYPVAPYPAPMAHAGHGGNGYAMPRPDFDRSAWLAECNERIRGVRKSERGAVIGGLLGAIAGGVVGNRTYDSERLAGTLIGAGVGGIAGLAIGAAVNASGKARRDDECAWYLDRHTGGYDGGPYPYGYGAPAYGYPHQFGYGYAGYAWMPVMIAVPQQRIVREYVTEEWVDVPVRTRTISRSPAPRPKVIGDKRIRSGK